MGEPMPLILSRESSPTEKEMLMIYEEEIVFYCED